jgi:hypothetical protein
MVLDVQMPMVNHIVSVEKIIVVDDVNFDIVVQIMVIYIIILIAISRQKHELTDLISINKEMIERRNYIELFELDSFFVLFS